MSASTIIEELKELGSESIKNVLLKHGAQEPFFGVKVEDLKKIQKRVKKNHELAIDLFDSGISDAMYLAGLIAEPGKMTKDHLQQWVRKAPWSMISEYTVPWVAAESHHGLELALEWIDDANERIATSGWNTLSSLLSVKPDSELDPKLFRQLLDRVQQTIHTAPNRVRYTMNGFVIALGSYCPALTEAAIEAARQIGKVSVFMGNTACKVPAAAEYIEKVRQKGNIGKKRKTAIC